jgi:uncharacterized surface protein with fasciclin (FAS1) repeats
MLKKVSSVFVVTAALIAATAVAQNALEPSALPAQARTAKKEVIDQAKKSDIVETAKAEGSFKTLAAALKGAGLVDTLKGKGPFTIFAPTDEAFAKLPKGTLDSLLQPENKEKLVAILTYHVVPGTLMAADIAKAKTAKTVNGESLTIKISGDSVMVNNAKVTKPDIACTNGVIHVVDAVLIPKVDAALMPTE